MKAKKFIAPALLGVFIFSSIISIGITAPQKQQEKDKKQAAKAEERIFIPREIKVTLQEGMATRQGRQDIPFTIFHHLYLPTAQQGVLQTVFFLKIKNADMGFAAMMPAAQVQAEKGKEKEKAEAAPPAEAQTPQQLQARLNIFLQFNLLQENQPPQPLREVYVPVGLQEEVSTYDANKEEVYTFGYPLPAGKYLLAMAVTTPDLKKIGTQYFEFALPNMSSASQPDTTSIFFIKKFDRMESVETRTNLHKTFFTYSVMKIEPNIDNIFNVGDSLDIFFYIFGVQPVDAAQTPLKYNIEINYEVKKGEETAIRWAPQTYDAPLISQPLPLKQTLLTKEQTKEIRDLQPGKYTLLIKVTDKVSGSNLTKTVDFEVK